MVFIVLTTPKYWSVIATHFENTRNQLRMHKTVDKKASLAPNPPPKTGILLTLSPPLIKSDLPLRL